MRTILLTALPLALCAAPLQAQNANADQIEQARAELQDTRTEYTAMRNALYREINTLDDEALKLSNELRALEREAELRTTNNRRLQQEIEGRETEFNYAVGLLGNYANAMLTRLHPAENQLYKQRVDDATARAGAAADDPQQELEERLAAAAIGLERLGEIPGGHRFDGKGLRNGSESLDGKFLMLGPSAYFTANNGSFEGVASFSATGTELPTVLGLLNVEDGIITGVISNGQGELPLDSSMGKALEVQAAEESLGETIEAGGIVGHAILLLGAVALALTLFKVWEITRFPVPTRRQINEILDDLLGDRIQAAKQKAGAIPGMAGDMVRVGVDRFYDKRRVLEEALFERLVSIKPKLDRFLPFLGLTAAAAPLMGLLGTVLGIIKTFKAMALYGSGNQKAFTQGISEALITTAEGLIVAIPVLVLHGLMKSLAKGKFSEIEGVAIALMNGTTELEKKYPKPARNESGEDDDTELLPNPI